MKPSAHEPMYETESGMSISERETQPKKALFLIAETEFGIETD